MYIIITLIILIGLGIYLGIVKDYEILANVISSIAVVLLIAYLLGWLVGSYNYRLFIEERNSFEQTLIEARRNGDKYEKMAIMSDIAKWNMKLAEYKYNNKTIFFDLYVNDNVELIKPIK